MNPGIYDAIPRENYHADSLTEQPALSAGIACILCQRSPAHARAAHPRLNPDFKEKTDKKFDVGQCVHALLLEGKPAEQVIRVVYMDDWRTKAAKELRDEARAENRIPLLEKDAEQVYAMLDAAKTQLADYQPAPFAFGKPEQTLVWDEDGIPCKARVDWLRDDYSLAEDFKTATNANPERWTRGSMFDYGYDLQAAFYRRGIEALTGERAAWRWIVCEKEAPFSLVVVEPGADVMTVAEAKVDFALATWRRCLERDEWPGYSREVVKAELPAWADDAKWLVEVA